MKCSNCNHKVNKDHAFCPYCGCELKPKNDVTKNETEEELNASSVDSDKNLVEENDLATDSTPTEEIPVDENAEDGKEDVPLTKEFEDFKEHNQKVRRKSLFYVLAGSIVLLFFTFSSVVLLDQLNNINKKTSDLESFIYASNNTDFFVPTDKLSDGGLVYAKHRLYSEGDTLHLDLYFNEYGDLKYDGKSIFDLNKADLNKFAYNLIENSWLSLVSPESFEYVNDLDIMLYINDETFASIKK